MALRNGHLKGLLRLQKSAVSVMVAPRHIISTEAYSNIDSYQLEH